MSATDLQETDTAQPLLLARETNAVGIVDYLLPAKASLWFSVGFLIPAAALCIAVLAGATDSFDHRLYESLMANRPETFAVFVDQVTALGNVTTLVCVSGVLALILHGILNERRLTFMIICLVGGRLLHIGLRKLVDRPRPESADVLFSVDSSSFPSGHTMMSVVVYVMFALLFAEYVPSRRYRIVVIGGAVLLAAMIGATRLYLGVHYLTDVVAGWFTGLAWVSACWYGRLNVRERFAD